jgi:nitroreductase
MSSIFKRVSVRDYQDKEVEDKKIELILKAAMAAPSATLALKCAFQIKPDE